MSDLVEPAIFGPNNGPDPELTELPAPRRPFRRLTLGCLALTAVGSAWFIYRLSGDLGYAASTTPIHDTGALDHLKPGPQLANRWVRGEGELSNVGGIRYTRPLEADSYRLAPLANNPNLWVQIRVPAGYEDEHFVVPTVFSGRLVPLTSLGLRYDAIGDAPTAAGWQSGHLPKSAWLLIDGETPKSVRWLFGLFMLITAFGAFSVWALASLLRPVPLPQPIVPSPDGA